MTQRPHARYCSACGAALTRRVPSGDLRERDCCDICGAIHYVNPRPVVGTIPVWDQHVLLCRRAIEPRHGFWTLPAGFMEVGVSKMSAPAWAARVAASRMRRLLPSRSPTVQLI